MTTLDVSTVGEWADRALTSFRQLRDAGNEEHPNASTVDIFWAAIGLVRACLALMEKLPEQSRREFASTLPFSSLELAFLRIGPIDREPVAEHLVHRLREWANRSPVLVDEVNVHAADFLLRLTPHLDLWSQREQVADAIERMAHCK